MAYRIKRTKNVSPERLDEAAAEVASVLRGEGIRCALAGGVALQAYGSSRLTGDVDLVANGTPQTLRVVRRLSFGGVAVRASNGVEVDVIVRDDDYTRLYRAALARAVPTNIGLRIVTPPFLMAMKLVAGRDHDLDDLRRLVILKPGSVKEAAALIGKMLGRYAQDDFEQEVRIARSSQRDPRRRRHL